MTKVNQDVNPAKVLFPGQPIQWHLPTTQHDRCPRCGADLGMLGRSRRACMGQPTGSTVDQERLVDKPDAYYAVHGTCPPGTVWECRVTPEEFLRKMDRTGAEAVRLVPLKKRGRPRRDGAR